MAEIPAPRIDHAVQSKSVRMARILLQAEYGKVRS